jgi:hypothetical protein
MIVSRLQAIRRDLFDEIGLLDPSFEFAHDYEFALRAASLEPLLLVPEYLYCYRWHFDTQPVPNLNRQALSCERAIKTLVLDLMFKGFLGAHPPALISAGKRVDPIRRGACIIRTRGWRLDLLSEAIASVQGQRLPLLPIVVVHGNDDVFYDVATWCRAAGPEPVCLQAGTPGRLRGYPANVGLDYVTARAEEFDFVCFLDDGDIFYPNFAERLSEALTFGGTDLVYAETSRREPWFEPTVGPRLLPPACLVVGNFITNNAFALRVPPLMSSGIRFDEHMEYLEDWDFLISLVGAGINFMPLFETLSEFRIFADRNNSIKRLPLVFERCREATVRKGADLARKLGPAYFYESVCRFNFEMRMPLEPSEIAVLADTRARFEAIGEMTAAACETIA